MHIKQMLVRKIDLSLEFSLILNVLSDIKPQSISQDNFITIYFFIILNFHYLSIFLQTQHNKNKLYVIRCYLHIINERDSQEI